MTATLIYRPVVVRTERGLTIAGTRITLYQIMDYLQDNYPHEKIMMYFNLTIREFEEVMNYIETHRDEVEAEYRQVLELAKAHRRYWEERNRERFEQIAHSPDHLEIKRKIAAWKKAKLAQEM